MPQCLCDVGSARQAMSSRVLPGDGVLCVQAAVWRANLRGRESSGSYDCAILLARSACGQGSDAGAGSVTLGGHYDSRPFEAD